MPPSLLIQPILQWITICSLDRILPNTGICALINSEQIAVFRLGQSETAYALSNYDPFSKAQVLYEEL